MKDTLSKIKKLISFLNEESGQISLPDSDTIDFSTAQEFGRNKYGDFDDKRKDSDTVLADLKNFLRDILSKKILLSPLRLQYNIDSIYGDMTQAKTKKGREEARKKVNIMSNIMSTLSRDFQYNLIGDTFEGLLMKEKDQNPGPDLSCGIELKATSYKSNTITLFSKTIPDEQKLEIYESLNAFINEIRENVETIEVQFGKRMYSGRGIDSGTREIVFDPEDGQQYERNRSGFVMRNIGTIIGDGKALGYFDLYMSCGESSMFATIVGRFADNSQPDMALFDMEVKYNEKGANGQGIGIQDKINSKLRTVFHVKGSSGNITDGAVSEKYVMFTGYEALRLKSNKVQDLITDGVLIPELRGWFKSTNIIGKKKPEKKELTQTIDFDSEDETQQNKESDEIYPNNSKNKLIKPEQLTIAFDDLKEEAQIINKQVTDLDNEKQTVLELNYISFKINMSKINKLFERETV